MSCFSLLLSRYSVRIVPTGQCHVDWSVPHRMYVNYRAGIIALVVGILH